MTSLVQEKNEFSLLEFSLLEGLTTRHGIRLQSVITYITKTISGVKENSDEERK